jgi:ATP-dependent helicase/nuclease subunit A
MAGNPWTKVIYLADIRPLHPLIAAQRDAVAPADNIWLTASAGTGKTQVLTARVVRLLLEEDVQPENLLCITFTKAGAAEMAERINQLLASWVQMDDTLLFRNLEAIGAKASPDARHKASELFAKVLDAPGGGLQILTIHSFCQSLLGSFPEEAGIVPGFRPVEGREQQELLGEALIHMIVTAEQCNDNRLIKDLQSLSLAMGEQAALKFLHKCASVPDIMASIPDNQGAVIWARRAAGVSFEGSVNDMLESELADEKIAAASIRSIAEQNIEWCKGKQDSRGGRRAAFIHEWLAQSPKDRADNFSALHGCWSNARGEPLIASTNWTPMTDAYAALALELHGWTNRLMAEMIRAAYADRLAAALLVGKTFAGHYAATKHIAGVVDFDDMIRKTAALLNSSNMAEWVRFKLDRQIDHILVDEAQDTNQAQWDIVRALSDDFYSGSGQGPDKSRTIFAVGDFKQAIYGFQGTAPERYQEAGEHFARRIADAGSELHNLTLSQSFRSTAPVLDFVNAVVAVAGPGEFGINDNIEDHYGEKPDIGSVELLAPVLAVSADQSVGDTDNDDDENWISSEKRKLATKLAHHVAALIDERPWLASKNRYLQPGDIMFLLRSRSDLAGLLVAQLHECGIPVAGVDRLRLLQPIVVQDLLACIRFVLQPYDNLSLACLLVSPLIGWSQERLLERGYRGNHSVSLWQHLRSQDDLADDIVPFREMLAAADFTTAYGFLEHILSGPIAGRKKFAARLGNESLIPIEEMLNAAIQFEQQHKGGLQAFLHWFDRGDIEIKREVESGANEVRVMTVHGAKGLQAPVVILADTTSDPTKKPDNSAELLIDEGHRVPLLPIRKSEQSGRLAEIVEKQRQRERQEHLRLLYVAMTRAEERLIIAGSLGVACKGEPPDTCWYTVLESAITSLGADWQADKRWGRVKRHVGSDRLASSACIEMASATIPVSKDPVLPEWLLQPAPDEQRPPRPLVPSHLDDDDYGDAPPSAVMRASAERGKLLHAVFERLTGHASLAQAETWLRRNNRVDPSSNDRMMKAVKAVLDNSEWAEFFSSDARSEVPLAAVIGETVVTGRLDRLVVKPGFVRVLDFKTGRQVPTGTQDIPVAYLRQMAHYAAALGTIFPGSRVEASLLFTHAPKMMVLPADLLEAYKPRS